MKTWKLVRTLMEAQPTAVIAFGGDGGMLATSPGLSLTSPPGSYRLFDPTTGKARATLTDGNAEVLCVTFGPKDLMASSHADGRVRIWYVNR